MWLKTSDCWRAKGEAGVTMLSPVLKIGTSMVNMSQQKNKKFS
jgi:hypothetical protein